MASAEIARERGAHDDPSLVRGGGKVRLSRLPARRANVYTHTRTHTGHGEMDGSWWEDTETNRAQRDTIDHVCVWLCVVVVVRVYGSKVGVGSSSKLDSSHQTHHRATIL